LQSEKSSLADTHGGTSSGRGITLDDVKRAYEKLEASGLRPSTRKVHEELGLRGSRTTIVKHYRVVADARRDAEPSSSPPLSPLVLGALAREIDRLVRERTSLLADELADARASLELLVEENEKFCHAVTEAESRTAALRVSLAEQSGMAEALRFQVESLSKQLEAEKSEAEGARQAIAIAKEHLRAAAERVTWLDDQEADTKSELAEMVRQCAELREHVEAKTRECFSLQTQVESCKQVEARLRQLESRAETLQAELDETKGRLASSEAQRSGLGDRLKDTQDALSRSEATGKQLMHKLFEATPVPQKRETR